MPKAKLTLQEQRALKAAKKAERKRLAEKQKFELENNHLFREIKYGQSTIRRHEKRWKEMLTVIAVPQMRVELEYNWHNFERVIDSKDFQISLLLDELKAGEEQYRRSVRSHTDDIDKIIVMCYDQIDELWSESVEMIGNLYKAATFERNDVISINNEYENHLKTMLYMLQKSKKEVSKLNRGEYLSRQEVEISKLNDFSTKFTDDLKRRYDTLWESAKIFLQKYISEYSSRKQEFLEFSRYDSEIQKTIRRYWGQVRDKMDLIKMLKSKYQELQITQNRSLSDLMREMEHFDKVYKIVKARVRRERKLDEKNLRFMVLMSNNVMNYLETYNKKGEKLLTLAAICRKFETIEEKILLFPSFEQFDQGKKPELLEVGLVSSAIDKKRQSRLSKAPSPEAVAFRSSTNSSNEKVYMTEMNLFWLRLAETEASRYKLSEQIAIIKKENEELKLNIFAYCQCLNCESQF